MNRPNQDLEELYREVILDHYNNPRKSTPLEHFNVQTNLLNPFCGDETSVRIRGKDKLEALSVSGRGCAVSQSSGSLMAEVVGELDVNQARTIAERFRKLMRSTQQDDLTERELSSLEDLTALAGVRKYPVRIKCALLPWDALENALKQLAS